MKAIIHFSRINRQESVYIENLVRDDGIRLDTRSAVPPEIGREMSSYWQRMGLLKEGQFIATISKHHFYQEWFGVMELRGAAGELLGFYCDLLTPLERRGSEYYLLDLLLDLWIFQDGSWQELDWDEFEEAVRQNRISSHHQHMASKTLRRMVTETRAGDFPWNYLT